MYVKNKGIVKRSIICLVMNNEITNGFNVSTKFFLLTCNVKRATFNEALFRPHNGFHVVCALKSRRIGTVFLAHTPQKLAHRFVIML